jgi:hypothetical protein
MNWKLLLGIPVIVFCILTICMSYLLYSFEHKYDHLPQVKKIPAKPINPLSITSYQGPHPSMMSRPLDDKSALIAIGQTGPAKALFAGPKQYPFLCNTLESGLGQPMVDNQQGIGVPVYSSGPNKKLIIGYSKDCLIPTQAWYYYLSHKDGQFYQFENTKQAEVSQIKLNGRMIPFIVRLEMGTINRFIYSIATLKGAEGELDKPDGSNWNKKLIYQFRGGIGIGHKQGKNWPTSILKRRMNELKNGYAVIFSTANQTANHYNIWLSEDTALRVKRQFNHLYGAEDYMVGIGGSGGAVQQYLIGQNNPGFLDAAIALYSYPDMITQTTYAFDCELMEYYFDVTDNQNDKWKLWKNRSLIEGMNASEGIGNRFSTYYDLNLKLKGYSPPEPQGMSECSKSWRGVTPLINNPNYYHHSPRYTDSVYKQTHWSHWEDLKYFYGVDKSGYARHTFDNVGVQYGLLALRNGSITLAEFLKLNSKIGGWKQPSQMHQEKFWKLNGQPLLSEFFTWSHHNMTQLNSSQQTIAPRTQGDIKAMQAAYRSGNVFLGKLDIPVIDLRHYLDDELDMHHASASFSTRLRMLKAQGHANNQLIWISKKPHDPLPDALEVIDKWIYKLKQETSNDIQTAINASRPKNAQDRCYSDKGEILAQGDRVWDGEWNNQLTGSCMKKYPIFSESRAVAGASLSGDTFKCALQSVTQAIESGLYQSIPIENHLQQMNQIFPKGVCDYSKKGLGRPADRLMATNELNLVMKTSATNLLQEQ